MWDTVEYLEYVLSTRCSPIYCTHTVLCLAHSSFANCQPVLPQIVDTFSSYLYTSVFWYFLLNTFRTLETVTLRLDRAMSTTVMPPGTSDYVDQIKKHLDYIELNRTPLAFAVNEIWRHLEYLTDVLIEGWSLWAMVTPSLSPSSQNQADRAAPRTAWLEQSSWTGACTTISVSRGNA